MDIMVLMGIIMKKLVDLYESDTCAIKSSLEDAQILTFMKKIVTAKWQRQ